MSTKMANRQREPPLSKISEMSVPTQFCVVGWIDGWMDGFVCMYACVRIAHVFIDMHVHPSPPQPSKYHHFPRHNHPSTTTPLPHTISYHSKTPNHPSTTPNHMYHITSPPLSPSQHTHTHNAQTHRRAERPDLRWGVRRLQDIGGDEKPQAPQRRRAEDEEVEGLDGRLVWVGGWCVVSGWRVGCWDAPALSPTD
jgi:hypothetical protein